MCGLLFTNLETNENNFREALNIMNYRGPESSQIKKYNDFYLGHNRLKIVDLKSESDQPFINNGIFLKNKL